MILSLTEKLFGKKFLLKTYAPVGIVRISICIGEFVVYSMIPTPGHQIILTRNYMADDKEDTQRKLRLVAVVNERNVSN